VTASSATSSILAKPKPGYEVIFTIRDYIDGPRSGVADFHGRPHFFECVFDDTEDRYSNYYLLTNISQEVFKAAQENWEIFLRWREAFDAGKTGRDSHPALLQDKDRYDETKRLLDQALASGSSVAVRVHGEFEPLGESKPPFDVITPWQVRWSAS
jgi:hypothetical protein